MKSLKKIALDFDSVLSDTMVAWTIKYNAKHKTEFSKDHIKDWSFWEQEEFNFSMDYAFIFFRESWKDWKNLIPTEPDLDKKVAKLSKFGKVDVVTDVEKKYFGIVKKWIDDHNISVNEIISSHKMNKIKDFDYNLYIDDNPLLAKDADSNNKNCFIYNQKWNRDIKPSQNVSRIKNLDEALDNILENGI